MRLDQLQVKNFRHFTDYTYEPAPGLNLIVAPNGSGKTSLLEAIHFLSMGRSFRSPSAQAIIRREEKSFQIFGKFTHPEGQALLVGIEKNLDNNKSLLKINGLDAQNTAELAKHLPVQLVFHETFHLLDAGPQYRREFLDWGVFYAEPQYFPVWQRFQYSLKQRNALLKNPDPKQLDFWEQELANQAKPIDKFRRLYLALLLPVIEEVLVSIKLNGLSIHYQAGWDNQNDYQELLKYQRQRDILLGHTQSGPHRADLKIKIHQHDADHILSRGQQKILSFSMRIAQALLLSRLSQQHCLFLVDDLAAELDENYIDEAVAMLAQLPCQVFMTAIHPQLFEKQLSQYPIQKFHVEQN